MKRSTNFMGNRATVSRKASTPHAIVRACRLVGMSDDEIRAVLIKAIKERQPSQPEPSGKGET